MDAIFNFIERHWATIRKHLGVFVGVAVISSGAGWTVAAIVYHEHISVQDSQLRNYRAQLHLTPTGGTPGSATIYRALQIDAFRFVGELRAWIAERRMEETAHDNARDAAARARSLDDEAGAKRQWDADSAWLMNFLTKVQNEYERRFTVKAVELHGELARRVKEGETPFPVGGFFARPSDLSQMEMVANEVERLARLLD